MSDLDKISERLPTLLARDYNERFNKKRNTQQVKKAANNSPKPANVKKPAKAGKKDKGGSK